jgi:hypothetical protein
VEKKNPYRLLVEMEIDVATKPINMEVPQKIELPYGQQSYF